MGNDPMKGTGECNTEGEEVNRELLRLLFVIIKVFYRLTTKNSHQLLKVTNSIQIPGDVKIDLRLLTKLSSISD